MKVVCQIAGTQLGEGPVWDPQRHLLYWVDIGGKKLHAFKPADGDTRSYPMPSEIGCLALTDSDRLLVALKSGIYFFDPSDGSLTFILHPEPDLVDHRFNDGKCDPQGRFWVGSTQMDHQTPTGSLYCMTAEKTVSVQLSGLTISNGLAWNSRGDTFYFIDTPTQQIDRYRYNGEEGRIVCDGILISLDEENGKPDGMCIDVHDHLWVAMYDGGQVLRIDTKDGQIVERIAVPVSRPTCCTFGGPDLDQLYITSASKDGEKKSGAVFFHQPGVAGHPASLFGFGRQF